MIIQHSINLLNKLSEIENSIKDIKKNLLPIFDDKELDEFLIKEINEVLIRK